MQRCYESMEEGHDGFAYWQDNDIQPEDECLMKTRYSAFIQGSSEIERYLRERKLDTVLITGTATNICCESTARDAMMLNFKTIMVADGLAASSDEEHNASLSAFYGQFGDVQTVEEVLQSLERGDTARAAA